MILRILLFILILFVASVAPTWVLIVCMVLYSLRYTAYELVVLGACIDVYYGTNMGLLVVPYYTVGVTLWLLLIEWAKPSISVYNESK